MTTEQLVSSQVNFLRQLVATLVRQRTDNVIEIPLSVWSQQPRLFELVVSQSADTMTLKVEVRDVK